MSKYQLTDADVSDIHVINGVIALFSATLLLSLILLAKAVPQSFFKSGFIVGMLYVLCLILTGLLLLFCGFMWASAGAVKERPKELTEEEKIEAAKKEAALHEQLSKVEKIKKEHVEEKTKRIQAEMHLAQISGGETLSPQLVELEKELEQVKTVQEMQDMVSKKKEEYPDQADLLDALLDKHRERLLRKEK